MQKRILIVDDDSLMRSLLKRQLVFPNCKTDTAACGSKALALVKIYRYNVIIIDFNIPDIEKTELIKSLQQECPLTPLIVMSGGLMGKEDILCNLGVSRFFEKPINFKKLKKIIEEILFY